MSADEPGAFSDPMNSKLGLTGLTCAFWFGQVVSDPQPRACEPVVASWTGPDLTGPDS
jgi:hypothetical protein